MLNQSNHVIGKGAAQRWRAPEEAFGFSNQAGLFDQKTNKIFGY
jgi:hypothetical protein